MVEIYALHNIQSSAVSTIELLLETRTSQKFQKKRSSCPPIILVYASHFYIKINYRNLFGCKVRQGMTISIGIWSLLFSGTSIVIVVFASFN